MTRRIIMALFAVAVTGAAGSAHATARYVGNCVKEPFMYPTISAAVSASVANDRINVCPGTYPEQVTINKPLFLAGMEAFTATGAQDRAVITLPAAPVSNVTSQYNGETFVAQILVQMEPPIEPGNFGVDIGNLTVDGSANPAGQPLYCQGVGLSAGLVGVFYNATPSAPGTVVRISDVTTRNQQTQNVGCGYGIWVENDSPTNQPVTIQHSSVHDFDLGGITAVTGPMGAPPALTATISGNFVHTSLGCAECEPYGILDAQANGTIETNVVTGGADGIVNNYTTILIKDNYVAGTPIGILLQYTASTATSNNITNVGTAFVVNGNNSGTGPIIKSNTTKKTQGVLDYNCTPNVTATSNTFVDSPTGFSNLPGAVPTGNTLSNIDAITSSGCS
jgi:hypothetical protein